jgi:hypothetical protein
MTTTERRDEEFRAVERTALLYLADARSVPGAEPLDPWRPRLRLWHYPAFEPYYAWSIFTVNGAASRTSSTMVRQLRWDRVADAERLLMPMTGLQRGFHTDPTIELRDRIIDADIFESRLAALRMLAFPVFAAPAWGIDGETFGIEVFNSASIEWWCDGPAGFAPIAAWAAAMRDWLAEIAAGTGEPATQSAR